MDVKSEELFLKRGFWFNWKICKTTLYAKKCHEFQTTEEKKNKMVGLSTFA